jgi:hypothetical protein
MNFQRLWENMKLGEEKKQSPDDKAMSAIRTGLGLREDFWDDFNLVVNNAEGLSTLLDIPVEKISTWRSKVEEVLDKVREADGQSELGKNKKIVKTGISVGQ